MVKQREDPDLDISGKVFDRAAYLREFVDYKETSTKKKRIVKKRLNDAHIEVTMLSNAEYERQLSRLVDIGYHVAWPEAVEFKRVFDRDPKIAREALELRPPENSLSDLMSTSELQRCFNTWKAQDPKLAELPSDVAKQILDDVVEAYIKFRKGNGADPKLLSHPKRKSLRFSYVRFVTRPLDDEDQDIDTVEEEVQVNDRALHIPRLGDVRFAAKKASLKFLRTANLRLMSATFRLHDDGKWRITIHFKRLAGKLVEKDRVISEIFDRLTWTKAFDLIDGVLEEGDPIKCDLPPDDVLLKEITKAGYHLRPSEFAKYKRDATNLDLLGVIYGQLVRASGSAPPPYFSTTTIITALKRRGIKIDAKTLAKELGEAGVIKERIRFEGSEKASYYSTRAISRAYRNA